MRVSCSCEFFMSNLLKSTSNGNILALAEWAESALQYVGCVSTGQVLLALACLAPHAAFITSPASVLVACQMPYSQDSLSLLQIGTIWDCSAQQRRKQWSRRTIA